MGSDSKDKKTTKFTANKVPVRCYRITVYLMVLFIMIVFVVKNMQGWQPATSAVICQRDLEEDWFKSQTLEDKDLMVWFKHLCNGTYLEMGGVDGVTFSNTYVFNKGLDWKGVLVELAPKNYEEMVKNRPNEISNVHAAVCDKKRVVHFVDVAGNAVGGVWEFAAESFRERFWPNIKFSETTPILCVPLRDILKTHVGDYFYFDFFSLDIEGAEMEAILSLDFSKVSFGMMIVEASKHNQLKNLALRTYLESNGYLYFREYSRNYWFVNKDFGSIYKNLLHD